MMTDPTAKMVEDGAYVLRMATPAILRHAPHALAEQVYRVMRDAGRKASPK